MEKIRSGRCVLRDVYQRSLFSDRVLLLSINTVYSSQWNFCTITLNTVIYLKITIITIIKLSDRSANNDIENFHHIFSYVLIFLKSIITIH